MRKIRILALLLAVLMIPFSLLVACKKDKDEEDPCADGHEWNKKEVTIEKRTCTTPGLKERTCKVCKLVEQYEWKPEGHTIAKAEWVYNEDATCTEDGTETRFCALCTYSETRVKENTKLGHNFIAYILNSDGYSETAACDRCSVVTNTRLVGIDIDFEGSRDSLSYSAFTIYTVEGITDVFKTEGEGETLNTFLQIDRTDAVGIGDHGYGVVFAPGYERLRSNKYVAEFDIKINKENTDDLVLLSGNKEYASVDFLKYDAATKTVSVTYGPIYTLKDADFDRWLKFSVALNDVERKYEVYIDNKLVKVDGVDSALIDYQNDGYYAGMNLENFKIAMTHEVGTPSTFALDNLDVYIAMSPKGYKGATMDSDYAVYETENSKDKIMYKKLSSECASHTLGDTVTVAATCYTDGYSYKECSACKGRTDFATTAAKLSHTQNGESTMEYIGKKDSTCTEYGGEFYECSLCGYKDRKVIQMKPHVIDTTAPSYVDIPATCISDGVIKGECKNCHCEMANFNGEYKFGHNIVDIHVVDEANCVVDGYSVGRCINPGCGIEEYRVNEIPAFGHTMKTEIVDNKSGDGKLIKNYCIRCKVEEYTTTQKLYATGDAFPSLAEMQELLGSNFYGGVDGTGFGANTFSTGGNNVEMRFTNDGSSSIAAPVTEGGNTFLRISHTGTGYLNYLESVRAAGQDVVLELSLRLPADNKGVTGTMTVAHRTTGHNAEFQMFKLDSEGKIFFIPGNCVIGTLNNVTFSKIAFVVKFATGTVDAYFNGELMAQNCLMKAGELTYVPQMLYEYRFLFDKASGSKQGIDVDDMYLYRASVPVYVTNPFVINAAGTDYDVSKNTPHNAGPYIQNGATGILGTGLSISSNKNFRAYAEAVVGKGGTELTALHCLKGDSVASIIGANNAKNESEIVSSSAIMKSSAVLLYNEIKFNAGSFTSGKMNEGRIVLAQGVKDSGGAKTQDFLVLENGVLKTGDGRVLFTVKQDEWISYNVVVNEADGTYDIYVNGNGLASGIVCNSDYITNKYSSCTYKFMIIGGGEFDFYIANTALHAGAIAPVENVIIGDVEQVTVTDKIEHKIDAITFYADQNVSSYYDYVGEYVLSADGSSLVLLSDEAVYAKKDGVTIANVDGKNVLRTTNYKKNNLKSIEFKSLLGVRLKSYESSPVYDLSTYDYLTVVLNAEATKGYNIIFKLMSKDGGYYQMRLYVVSPGRQTVMLPLKANADNEYLPYFKSVGTTSGVLDDVVSLRIEFAGGIAGNGNGELADETTISFESISFERATINNVVHLGENVDLGKFCKEHNYVDVETVNATCTSSGYTKQVCNVCGHIAVKEVVKPVAHKKGNETTIDTSCTADGIKVTEYSCDCGCNDKYPVISKIEIMLEHNVTDGTCSICNNALPPSQDE